MELLKLFASRVQLGVALPWNVRNASGMLLLARGHVVVDGNQLRQLLERGAYVDAEEVGPRSTTAGDKPAPPRAHGLFEEWAAIYQRLERPLKQIGREPEFPQLIDALARATVTLIERDVDVSIYTIVRQENVQFFNYGFTHSVHTAVASVLTAQRLDWPKEKTLLLAKAALTMNVAIAELQGRIATQDGPLLDEQNAEIRAHPDRAIHLLQAAGVSDPDWLAAVAEHHELPDGSGYPRGITDITPMALILRHADTFTARISPRASRPGISAQSASRELFQEDRGGPMSAALIKQFGIHPPGDFVKLASGEYAIVMRRSEKMGKPLVASVTDKLGNAASTTFRRDTADPDFAIVSAVTDKRMVALLARVPPQRLYGLSV